MLHKFAVTVRGQTIKVLEDLPKKLSKYRELNTAKETMLLWVQKRNAAVEKLEEDIKTDFDVESRKCCRYLTLARQRNRKELAVPRRRSSDLTQLRCRGRRELYQHRVQ